MSSISEAISEMTEAGFSIEIAVSGDYHVVAFYVGLIALQEINDGRLSLIKTKGLQPRTQGFKKTQSL